MSFIFSTLFADVHLVTSFDDIDVDPHIASGNDLLPQSQHQAISWTNADVSSVRLFGNHLRVCYKMAHCEIWDWCILRFVQRVYASPQLVVFSVSCWAPFSDCSRSSPFYLHGLTLIPAWISNHMPDNVWNEIAYPFPIFNGATGEVWEWICNFIPHFIIDVITYPCGN